MYVQTFAQAGNANNLFNVLRQPIPKLTPVDKLTLSLALGRVTALSAGRLLEMVSLGAAAAAECVRLVTTLSEGGRTLRLKCKTSH